MKLKKIVIAGVLALGAAGLLAGCGGDNKAGSAAKSAAAGAKPTKIIAGMDDTFAPMGPCIVTADEFDFPPALHLTCRVNGELRQDSNTKLLVHGIPYIISELSKGMTLRAGTIIATGTPAGTGIGMNPPQFLKSGDVVECSIEGIGTLRNRVK